MPRTIIITGPPGVGKTSVAQTLAANLEGTTARLCGDAFVLAVTPFEINDDRRLFLRQNMASFARLALEHKYDWIVLECVIPSDEFIDDLTADIGVGRENFSVFSLLATTSAYETRLREKLDRHDLSAVDFDQCTQWLERIRALRTPLLIDTSRQTLAETVAEILDHVL